MAYLIDTNIIIDVITDDPKWADWSICMLERYSDDKCIINPTIYTELCFGFSSTGEVDGLIRDMGFGYRETSRHGLYKAAMAFRSYKNKRGKKLNVLPDFIIGGHAEAADYTIITRDIKRYQTYFPSVKLIHPQ